LDLNGIISSCRVIVGTKRSMELVWTSPLDHDLSMCIVVSGLWKDVLNLAILMINSELIKELWVSEPVSVSPVLRNV
jgi:hypothetical protein